MARGDIILRLVRISKTYIGKKDVKALKTITASFKRGEFVAIVGHSGSGKSTLINILGGLDRPTSGDYYCEGNNVTKINEQEWDALRNKKIGFIFQNYFLIEYLSVYKNVELALQFQTVPKKMKDAKIRDIIEKVGLKEHMFKLPSELSGGQRQRVAVARALVKDPDIILADEPTGSLDYKTADDIVQLLKGSSQDRLVIMVTHDRKLATKYANRIIEIDRGYFTLDLVKEDIEHTYQNVFRKIKPVSLTFKDKFVLTFNKIKLHYLKHLFIALSLALIFSLSIITNGFNRGITEAFYDYYDQLNQTNAISYQISTVSNEVTKDEYNHYINTINYGLQTNELDVISAYSNEAIYYGNKVENVIKNPTQDNLLDHTSLHLIDHTTNNRFEPLMIKGSKYPTLDHSVMVSSKFIQDYFQTEDVSSYLGQSIALPQYTVQNKEYLRDLPDIFLHLYKDQKGSIVYPKFYPTDDLIALPFTKIDIPAYCFYKDDLNPLTRNSCMNRFSNNPLFNEYSDYIAYIVHLQKLVNSIDEAYFSRLFEANGIVYFPSFIKDSEILSVYQFIYDHYLKTERTPILNIEGSMDYTITAIVDNPINRTIYFTKENYNRLFNQPSDGYSYINGFYTTYLNGTKSFPLEKFNYLKDRLQVTNSDQFEVNNSCPLITNTSSKNFDGSLLKDNFYYNDYKSCASQNNMNTYMTVINVLSNLFFYCLIVIGIIFYSMLLKIVFKGRMNEIGIFRSLGSTNKDIKRLFVYEAVYLFSTTILLAFLLIIGLNKWFNVLFMAAVNRETNVISLLDLHLLVQSQSISKVSYLNLIIQSLIVIVAIIFLASKTIKRISQTNPMETIRGDEYL